MSDFIAFARAHGVLINALPPLGVWRRYPTESKPRHRNGAVKWMGDHAFVCDWATGGEVHVWKTDASVQIDHAKIKRMNQEAERVRLQQQTEAARKAAWIMHQCQIAKHPYLANKGFPDEQGNVWQTDDGLTLVIPMRIGPNLVGCQLIKEDGTKKFLFGQRTNDATFCFDNKGPNILCEGYATALSVRAALKAVKRRYTLYVTFSAGNMVKVAASLKPGLVIADNDASRTGEEAAKKIGWPYWMPPDVGDDFNDFQRKVGLFRSSQALTKVMQA